MCQMPLEEYARKCDSFVYNVEQYVQSHHTFDVLKSDENKLENMNQIENLQNSLQHYLLESQNEIALAKATKSMLEDMQAKDLHMKSVADLERETQRLERDIEMLEHTHDILQEQLILAVNTCASQKLELVLYENNKLKLERAEQRYNIDKEILQIVNDSQRYAELIWIGTQFDLERWRNLTENYKAQQANNEAQNIGKRMEIMRQLPAHDETSVFLKQMAEILTQHLGEQVQPDAKSCFYEYAKIMRLHEHNLHKFSQPQPILRINEIDVSTKFLKTLLFDAAISKPAVAPVRFSVRSEMARMKLKKLESELRELRANFSELNQRFNENKFWRYSQVLWMWFLTEPERVLFAIEEVKKAAAKTLSRGARKPVAGIQRKQ